MPKPHLTPDECRWMGEVHRSVMSCDRRGSSLVEAFSDVHDGNLTEAEIASLVRQRLLRVFPLSEPMRVGGAKYEPTAYCSVHGRHTWSRLLGYRNTVDLTERAIRIFWPDRATL